MLWRGAHSLPSPPTPGLEFYSPTSRAPLQGGISATSETPNPSGKPPPQALSFRLCCRHWTELPFTHTTFSAKVGAGAGWRKVCACARACFKGVVDIARPSRKTGKGGEFRKSVSVTAQPPYRWLILKRKRKQAGNESFPPPRQLPPSALSLGARAENRACAGEHQLSPLRLSPRWARKRGRLEKVVTVSCGTLDPRNLPAAKAVEATSPLTGRSPCLRLPGKQPAVPGAWASFP